MNKTIALVVFAMLIISIGVYATGTIDVSKPGTCPTEKQVKNAYGNGVWKAITKLQCEINQLEAAVDHLYWLYKTGKLKGEKGDKGDTGATGPQGPAGLTGPQGPQGIPGTNGTDGVNGKDGKDGEDGTDGLNGKDGEDGKDGANGVSGYEIVKESGNCNDKVTAECPSGKKAISGGINAPRPVVAIYPSSETAYTGILVGAETDSDSPGACEFTVYVTCAIA